MKTLCPFDDSIRCNDCPDNCEFCPASILPESNVRTTGAISKPLEYLIYGFVAFCGIAVLCYFIKAVIFNI
jgi:hypothetical protein